MKTHFAALLLATAALFAPVASVATTSAKPQPICGAELPRPYDRPGGFCDLRNSLSSLSTPVENTESIVPVVTVEKVECSSSGFLIRLRLGERVLVAC